MTADSRTRALVVIGRFLADLRGHERISDRDRADAQVLYDRLVAEALTWQAEQTVAGGHLLDKPVSVADLPVPDGPAPGAAVLHAVKDEAGR